MENKHRTLIISGGKFELEFVTSYYKLHSYDRVIAVDYGEQYARMAGIPVDLLVGDFDTRGVDVLSEYERAGIPILRSVPEKDDTDTEMAIKECIRNHSDFDIMCATGGRIDHLLGNIHNLKLALDAGLSGRILDSVNIIELHSQSFAASVKSYPFRYFSLIPFAGTVRKLTLRGFKYNVTDYDLEPGLSLGISNEITGEEGFVDFKEGILIVINSKD